MIQQKNSSTDGLSLAGIAFGTASSFYIMLISLKLEANHNLDMETKLLLAASYIQATGILLSFIFRKVKLPLRTISCLFCGVTLVLQVLIFYNIPSNFTLFNGTSYTAIKSYMAYGLVCYYIGILILIYLKRKTVDMGSTRNFYFFMLLNIITAIEVAVFKGSIDVIILISSGLKLLAYSSLYKMLVNSKISNPMEELYKQVNDNNYILGVKNRTLQEAVEELEKQIISRKRYERKLKYAEEKYQKIVDNSPEAIYIQDGNVITFMNKAARSFFGLGVSESIIGISFLDFVDGDDIKVIRERLRRTQEEKLDCEPHEVVCHCFDGSTKVLEVTDIYINLEGRNVTLSIGLDVTGKRKLEEESKRLKEAIEYEKIRSNFFSNISHELRTPVNLIYSCIQVMELYKNQETIGERAEDYHNTMKQNCLRLIRIINNIIDITKMDSGYYSPSYSKVEIVSLFENITEAVIDYTKDKEKAIIFDTDIEEKEMYVDRELLERLLLNLLSNAVKFGGTNGNIEVHAVDREDGIEIRVKDYGVGIPEQHLPHIFDKFTQVDKSIRRGQEGSGLGLAIVKSIADIHGGTIKIQSALGIGSTIIVFIPDNIPFGYNQQAYFEAAATTTLMPAEKCDITQEECIYCGQCSKIEKECIDKVILEFSDIYF
jgi:PAS domain S-box-containing protein